MDLVSLVTGLLACFHYHWQTLITHLRSERDCEKGLSESAAVIWASEYSFTFDWTVKKNQCQFSAIIASHCLPSFFTIKDEENFWIFAYFYSRLFFILKKKQTRSIINCRKPDRISSLPGFGALFNFPKILISGVHGQCYKTVQNS